MVGSFVMDLTVKTARFPNEGETVLDGLSFSTASGGKGANQAVQAARLGASVSMVGKVGKDAFGSEMLEYVKGAGVNVDRVLCDPAVSSGIGSIILEEKPGQKTKNRIIVTPGANLMLTPEDVRFVRDIVGGFDMVMLQLEIPMAVNEAVAEYAAEKGVPVMLNSAPSAPLAESFLSRLTYISPNEHEAYDLTGIRIETGENGADLDTVRRAGEALLGRGVRNVIITLGSNGVAFLNRGHFLYRPCVDVVKVVDPTAAGDSFVGAFCYAKCAGMKDEEALDFANFTATLTVSKPGAQRSLPLYGEVEELIRSVKHTACDKARPE